MKFLSLTQLIVEPTRRCNARPQCQHCYKGSSEQIDLDGHHIDCLFDQVEHIGEICFLGGEPTLAFDVIDYTLNALKQREIPVLFMRLVTNGLTPVEPVAETLKRWSEYVSEWQRKKTGKALPGSKFVELRVSQDRFHPHQDVARANYKVLCDALRNYASVHVTEGGNMPVRQGNAKNLPEGDTLYETNDTRHRKQIGILEANHTPACFGLRGVRLAYPKQVIITCPIYLTAKGALIPGDIGNNMPNSVCDEHFNRICYSFDDVYESIKRFNRGKLDCFQYHAVDLQTRAKAQEANYETIAKHLADAISGLKNARDLSEWGDASSSLTDDERQRLSNPATASGALSELANELYSHDFVNGDWGQNHA